MAICFLRLDHGLPPPALQAVLNMMIKTIKTAIDLKL
jgi:hypothetical protein